MVGFSLGVTRIIRVPLGLGRKIRVLGGDPVWPLAFTVGFGNLDTLDFSLKLEVCSAGRPCF